MNTEGQNKVDLRQIPPPQRHPLIFSTFGTLAPGEAMILVNDHDPKPLYYQFQATMPGQFAWDYLENGPEVWRVEIRKLTPASHTAEPEALAVLLREHRDVEAHLDAARRWIPTLNQEGSSAVEELAEELRTFGRVVQEDLALHIAHEDQALFPVLARYIGDRTGPIAMMLLEHRHLEGQEARYRAGLEQKDARVLADAAGSIVSVLSAHIWKEENVLFPLAQRTLRPADWDEVLGLIRAQR
jgi:uncharacterized protein (DUF2249 family)/hemerythrin-like domain-containing protein